MPWLTLALVVLLPMAMVWMVVRVLKDGQPSEHTFDEQFYDDKPEPRV